MTTAFIDDYWGKTGAEQADKPRWHPLACHALDVAAVANALLTGMPDRLQRMAAHVNADAAALQRFLVLLTALHDVGKFSGQFQAKSDVGPKGKQAPPAAGIRHDAIGYLMRDARWSALEETLSSHIDGRASCGPDLWAAVTGHHGQPAIEASPHWEGFFGASNKRDAADFVRAMGRLFALVGTPLPDLSDSAAAVLSWHLAGLVNVCDWIGSNSKWFPFVAPPDDLHAYWALAKQQAEVAVREAGILPTACPDEISTTHLLPHITGALTPLQSAAHTCALPAGPLLAIVEDVTGAGKTEAALIIAARLMAQRRAGGVFFALPTMATANAMYDRLSESYRRLFADGDDPSLVLAHGRRALHDGFRDSILKAGEPVVPEHDERARLDTPADLTASAACAAWIADDRRKAFLADVGVGTIDQALLGVLPTRFQALRLWGLADRILIVDEAHSFDSYLSRELETLLEFHASLGGSAVVLSATLNDTARSRIASAFRKGLGCTPGAQPAGAAYPLLTLVAANEITPRPVAPRAESERDLAVRRISTPDDAVAHVASIAERGGCVAWIRNTVDDAIAAFEAVRARGREPLLLHARFAMGDRLRREAQVQALLGKGSAPAQRHGVVLLGTQILEQSLDYDVDAMITDLAPIDMVIQRAGRLWRHPWRTERPLGSSERELLLLSPDPNGEVGVDWYRDLSKGAAVVYPHHGYVWRSAKALAGHDGIGAIRTPAGIRDLLAVVYDETRAPTIPEGIERATLKAVGEWIAARALAAGNCLDVRQGYLGNNALWQADTVTPTRLGLPVTVFRLARRQSGEIVPWHPLEECDGDLARAWALSECAVGTRLATGVPVATGGLGKEIEAAKASWPKWEQEQPLLLLDPCDDGVWRGRVVAGDKGEREVLYDHAIGWRLAPA